MKNRIRGWFPKEPNLTKPIQHTQPTTINQKNMPTDVGATKQRTFFLIFLPIEVLMSLTLFCLIAIDFHVAWQVGAIGVILGLVAGSIISIPFTKKELKLLGEKNFSPFNST